MTNQTPIETAPKKPYHHGDLRSALVAVAREILVESGLEKLSLRGVAKRAGVSQAAPYHHFKNRDELLEAVAAEGFAELRDSLVTFARKDENDFMRGMGVGYVVFAVRNPALFRLMQGAHFADAGNAPVFQEAANRSFNVLVDGVREALPDADEEQIMIKSAASWSIVHGLATLMLDGRLGRIFDHQIDEEEIAQLVIGQLQL